MDFKDSVEEAKLRGEARAFLSEAFPRWRASAGEPTVYDTELMRGWHRVMFDAGWGAPHWPPQHGGKGFGPVEATIWNEEKARVGANLPFNIVGFGMAGPTIILHANDEQQQRFLPPLLRGDDVWCQLFSEPGAGSDLAGLTTRAERDGDGWIVNGQKVWSSNAHEARYAILLARSDFDVPKHKGLVYLVADMHADGIDVRPLRQMNGGAEFSEVFLTDVRVPDANRIGEPGDGWRVAMTTLMHERMSIGAATAGFTYPFERLVAEARTRTAGTLVKRELAKVYTNNKILELLNARVLSKLKKGEIPTAEGSILKLALANLVTQSAALGVRLLEGDGMVSAEDGPQQALLQAPAFHIGGGTDEVQRNLVAEQVLGLPREPRPDKEVPFRTIARS